MSDAMLTGSEEISQCNITVGSLLSSMLSLWHLIVMLPIYQLIGRTLWNTYKLKLLPGKEFTNIATHSKKDDCTEIANITMPMNSHETSNLKKILTVKVNAKVMITTNINVNDGLTNGAMGTVTNVVIDERTGKMICILVVFDSKHVGQEAIHTSAYKNKNKNAVPIYKTQATFPIHKKHHVKQQEVSFH